MANSQSMTLREMWAPRVDRGATVATFAPWVIYWIVADGPSTWFYGALCAWLAAFMLGVTLGRGRGLKMLDLVTLVFFAGVTIFGAIIGAQDRDWMDTYAMTLSSGVLSAMMFASLMFVPITEQYARDTVPRKVWRQAAFKEAHRRMTAMVGVLFAIFAILGYISVEAPQTSDWTNWVLPFLLIVGAAPVLSAYAELAQRRPTQPGAA
jgi:hypothetical protein